MKPYEFKDNRWSKKLDSLHSKEFDAIHRANKVWDAIRNHTSGGWWSNSKHRSNLANYEMLEKIAFDCHLKRVNYMFKYAGELAEYKQWVTTPFEMSHEYVHLDKNWYKPVDIHSANLWGDLYIKYNKYPTK